MKIKKEAPKSAINFFLLILIVLIIIPQTVVAPKKAVSNTTISAAPLQITYGQAISISGSIFALSGDKDETTGGTWYKEYSSDGANWNSITSGSVSAPQTSSGFYFQIPSQAWTPNSGKFQLRTGYSGDSNYRESISDKLDCLVNKSPTSTTIQLSSANVPFGQNVIISGVVSSDFGVSGNTASGTWKIQKLDEYGWSTLFEGSISESQTENGFSFSIPATSWRPPSSGTFDLRIEYFGDSNYEGSKSIHSILTVDPQKVTLNVNTFPALENVHFRIDDVDEYTDSSGNFTKQIAPGRHKVELVDTSFNQSENAAYMFTKWSGIRSDSDNPIEINIEPSSTSTVIANFDTYFKIMFTQSGVESGRDITLTVNDISHNETTLYSHFEWFKKDTPITFSVTEIIDSMILGKRYSFLNWKNSTGSTISSPLTVSSTDTLTAYYKTEYKLDIETNPSGISSISGSGWYDDGSEITTGYTITKVTFAGVVYDFSTWEIDGVAVSGNPINILMDSPHRAIAVYKLSDTSLTPPETANLYICVKNLNNNVISGAEVQITQQSEQVQLTGTTDTNGYLVFNNISAGSYTIKVSKNGYITSTKSVTVQSDKDKTEIILLQPSEIGDLLVFVEDSDKNPIVGANITLTPESSGGNQLKEVTNSAGYAVFFKVVSGVYSIQVSKTGYNVASKQVIVETEKADVFTIRLQKNMPPSITTTQAVPLWIYVVGLLVLWAGTLTVLMFFLRTDQKAPSKEAHKSGIHTISN